MSSVKRITMAINKIIEIRKSNNLFQCNFIQIEPVLVFRVGNLKNTFANHGSYSHACFDASPIFIY